MPPSVPGARAVAVYDMIAGLVRGRPPRAARRRRAFGAPVSLWERALWIERCGPELWRALRASPVAPECPAPLRLMLGESAADAVRNALRAHGQLEDVAALAHAAGIPVLALKGAARLLLGEPPGARPIGDVDLLVAPADAAAIHALLGDALGYVPCSAPEPHHLAAVKRPGGVPVELHVRLEPAGPTWLDGAVWREARWVRSGRGGAPVAVPSPTHLLLHTLAHATRGQRPRYRLRDVLDAASLWTTEIDGAEVRRFLRERPERAAIETLLSAAAALAPGTSARARDGWRDGWRTVRRVGRARLIAVAGAPTRAAAGRRMVYAQTVAEGSPRVAAWLAAGAWRRVTRAARRLARAAALGAAAGAVAGSAAGGCSDATRPSPPVAVPPLVFVSDAGGYAQLFRLRHDTVVRLTTTVGDDRQPSSAAGRVAFASNRDGNDEIYLTDLDGSTPRRITTNTFTDSAPTLDPTAQRIAFVSDRSGTPRLWVVDTTTGATASQLSTGSASFVPELAPAWSPAGDMIAFTSTRTGTSQVFVVPAAGVPQGGSATQVSHEATGAFDPTWETGDAIVYTALGGAPHLVRVTLATGEARPFASDARGLGEASCAPGVCVAVAGPGSADGDLVAISTADGRTAVALRRAANDRQPAVIP